MPKKRVAIVQSNYIPWKGYFDMIASVDEFIIYDDMQYTRRDWRNRNRIKTPAGTKWLTIPVECKGRYLQKIKDTVISEPNWNRKHWQTIAHNYSRAPYFDRYRDFFQELYLTCQERFLSKINYLFLKAVCRLLGIDTMFSWSMDYRIGNDRTESLVSLCRQAEATEYISGPAAKTYIEEERFVKADITLTYMNYSGYPEYAQLYPPFEHTVSIIDLIFNTGPDATRYMKIGKR
ncbi:MAG: WbqC family protein [Deltaproteobacteria bacterium]